MCYMPLAASAAPSLILPHSSAYLARAKADSLRHPLEGILSKKAAGKAARLQNYTRFSQSLLTADIQHAVAAQGETRHDEQNAPSRSHRL